MSQISANGIDTSIVKRWKRYPAYKDSGVEWLGEIPEHWFPMKIKYLTSIIRGKFTHRPRNDPRLYDGNYPFIQTGDVAAADKYIKSYEQTLNELGFLVSKQFPKGTLVMTIAANIGDLAILDFPACFPDSIVGFLPKAGIDLNYLYFNLKAMKSELMETAIQNTQLNLNVDRIGSLFSVCPPLPEQQTIASFLDHETAKIDALIAKKERLIELLQEKRTAIVSHAVTKGLDPTVPLRDSGVGWLGEVPEHWEVKRLKFISDIQSGVAKGRDLGDRNVVELPYLRVANVQDGYLDLSDIATITIGQDEIERYLLRAGDVLMNEGGDYDKLGRGAVWQGQVKPCIHQNHVYAVRPHQGVNPYWINTVTLTSYAKHYFILKSKQSTNLASISSTNLKELPVVIPPALECDAILAYIDEKTTQIDTLIAKIREGIEKLKEYRTALISAAVTGKIDVRNEVAS